MPWLRMVNLLVLCGVGISIAADWDTGVVTVCWLVYGLVVCEHRLQILWSLKNRDK